MHALQSAGHVVWTAREAQTEPEAVQRDSAGLSSSGVVAIMQLPGPVAHGRDAVGVDELGADAGVVVAVELVSVAPGIAEVVGPAEVEVDDIGGL